MRPQGTPEEIEQRRRKAIALLEQGKKPSEVAKELGVARQTISWWKRIVRDYGKDGLKCQPHPHRESRLSLKQRQKLRDLLLQGPQAHGYADQLWTLERIANVIKKHFGIGFHPSHVWRILQKLGWSCQKPERIALEQDQKKVEAWRKKTWPTLKRGKKGTGLH